MEKSYTNLLYSLQQNQIPINKGKKIQIKVQAENNNKAIGKDKLQVKKGKKDFMPSKIDRYRKEYRSRFYAVQNRSTYNKMERKKETKNIITYCTRLNIIVINLL